MTKCCYMYFSPKKREDLNNNDDNFSLKVRNTTIPRVKETRFLGVVIDEKLSWIPHIDDLAKRLKCHIGSINRIKDNLPTQLHKQIYHTLFESHLTYGITVWGGVSPKKLEPLLRLQKKCLRILFGDKEVYLNKFKTAARCRLFGSQSLGAEFFARENSKPLFNSHTIMTLHNLYTYHITQEAFKILKFRTPISLYSLFTRSARKDTLLIKPQSSHHFISNAADLWNLVRQKLQVVDLSLTKIGAFKVAVKSLILKYQKIGDLSVWNDNELDIRQAVTYNCLPDF